MFYALLILAALPNPNVYRESVDKIELNHVYNEWGQNCFSQIIIWDTYSKHHQKPHVVKWFMVKDCWEPGTAEEQKEWEAARDEWLRPIERNAELYSEYRSRLNYRGVRKKSRFEPTLQNGKWTLRYYDDRHHVWRVIVADAYVETHTSSDPERLDREEFPEDLRRKLRQPPKVEKPLPKKATVLGVTVPINRPVLVDDEAGGTLR